MNNEKVYKPIVKKFLKQNVRVIKVDTYHEYIVCKDMFDILGLTDKDGKWNKPKKKMLNFLDGLGEKEGWKTFPLLVKQGKTKTKQMVECLDIEIASVVLTQFQPTKRRGEEVLNRWFEFMKFVKVLLETYSANKYIIQTKNIQKEVQDELYNDGGDPYVYEYSCK